jgi:4-diphosphocytidyl-2-C-methyl-D-erythritol kinase
LAAPAGSTDYGAISVKVAYWATARLLGDVPPTVFVPQPKVTSSIIEITRRDSPAVDIDPRELFTLVRTAFGQRRKMLRRSLANVVDITDFERAGISPTARPEELDVVTWGRLAHTVHSVEDATVIQAPAKLTLSLRVTGVRDDGYHLIDAVMTSLDLCDEIRVSDIEPLATSATSNEDDVTPHSRLEFTGPYADGIPTDSTNLVHRALDFVGRSATVSVTKNIPHGGGLGGGSTDAAAIIRWAGRTSSDDVTASASIGADVPFCVRGGRAIVRGIGEVIEPLPYVEEQFTLVVPPLRVSTPAVYTAWDELGGPRGDNGNDLEPAAIHVEPLLAEWRDRIHEACGIRPILAGSGATWFVSGHHLELVDSLPDAEVRVVRTRPSDL